MDTCVAFRVAGTSGVPDKISSEDASLSRLTPDYLSIVLHSSLIMLLYILAIMACVWARGRRNGEGEKKLSEIFKKEKSQKKSLKITKKIEDHTVVDIIKFSIVDKIYKIRQKSQIQKSMEKPKKPNFF